MRPQIAAIAPGDPFDRLTWSGTAFRLVSQIRDAGCLAGAASGQSAALERVAQAAAFTPTRGRWAQRYMADVSPLAGPLRTARTRVAARRLAAAAPGANALLQIGAWYDGSRLPGVAVRSSYHDGNLALYLRRPDALLDRRATSVRRALALEKAVYDGMDVIFTMSDWLRRSFVEDFGQDERKVVAVGAGPNFDRLPPPVERGWASPRLLFVGKGSFDRKGGPVLLEAFARLRARFPDAQLRLVGPAVDPAPPPGVAYLGRISRADADGRAALERAYSEATAFVLPSLYEPFGVAFLEAMAYALPCVGAISCAMPEIVEDGVTGLLAPPGDVDALTDRLETLVSDPARARTMGEAGRARLERRYTWPAVAGRMIDAIGERLT